MTDDQSLTDLVTVSEEELREGALIGLSPAIVISSKVAQLARDAHKLGVKPATLAKYYATSSKANAEGLAAAAAEVKLTAAELAELAVTTAANPRGMTLALRNAALARARPAAK